MRVIQTAGAVCDQTGAFRGLASVSGIADMERFKRTTLGVTGIVTRYIFPINNQNGFIFYLIRPKSRVSPIISCP